ncbi:hypothetical protein GPALN_006638 [Globodera pallida]|nr:hypothetical protein GPALN_006638 [Globodera pallida]
MSISTKSTNSDITADPEWWPPNFANLDPSEEMRLLHARIAQLKHQQATNSPTSSASFDLLVQNGNAKVGNADTLGDRNEIGKESHGETQANIAEFVPYREKMAKMELELEELKEEMKGIKHLEEELKDIKKQLKDLIGNDELASMVLKEFDWSKCFISSED